MEDGDAEQVLMEPWLLYPGHPTVRKKWIVKRKEEEKMSGFSRFMKANKKEKKNGFFAPTASLTDADGNPLRWEFRHLGSKECESLRDDCTMEVQVKGKPNLFRPKLNTTRYLMELITASTVYPDLYNKELQDSYGVRTPDELIYAMVDDAGEYQEFCAWVQEFQGFAKQIDEKVEEAKN